MKKLFLLFLLTVSTSLFVQAQTTSVYIVRHGEKLTDNPSERDPSLSADGKARAISLAEVLKNSNISAIFTTNYKRTKETAQPTAAAKNITIETYNPSDPKGLAEKIKAGYAGKTVLIVGHSNTVLELTEAFGAVRPLKELTDEDYDNLFFVSVSEDKATATSEKFGKPHHAGN